VTLRATHLPPATRGGEVNEKVVEVNGKVVEVGDEINEITE
jgi:hypothetical protein